MARTILVTGASAGIGQAICRRLLDDGDGVVGIARDFTKAGLEHKRFTPVQLDLETVDRLAEQLPALVADHADVDGLVCNAGRGRFGELEQFSYGQIRGLMDLNFTSHAFLVRSFLPQLKRGSGDVVFTGSEARGAGPATAPANSPCAVSPKPCARSAPAAACASASSIRAWWTPPSSTTWSSARAPTPPTWCYPKTWRRPWRWCYTPALAPCTTRSTSPHSSA